MARLRPIVPLAALATAAIAAAPLAYSLVTGPPAAQRPSFAQLLGASEVPGPGDADGRGASTVFATGPTTVCYSIVVTGIAKPTAAHIHKGGPSTAGPVVVPLTPPARGTGGAIAGCVTAPAATVAQIKASPGSFYVNVHNGPFGGGAIRGTLFRR